MQTTRKHSENRPESGAEITIVGLGRSAVGAARLLQSVGAKPFVTEHAKRDAVAAYADMLEELGVPYETGGHSDRALASAEWLVLSPGASTDIPLAEEARQRNISVIGELELGWRYCTAPILAVTGTNGKTTTTELLRTMIEACGYRCLLAGNNATPLSEAVLAAPAPDYIVCEVSSYQLETAPTFRPWIGAVLNLTPDHLGRHRTMEGYAATKALLFARQEAGDAMVVNADDPYTAAMTARNGVGRIVFSISQPLAEGVWCDGTAIRTAEGVVCDLTDIVLPGRHNLSNALAAIAIMHAGGFKMDRIRNALREFRGVEHRIEYVTTIDGVEYYNDSKSTNVDSLRVALESFPERRVVLIAGGRGKGSDYGALRGMIGTRVSALVTIGEDAPRLEKALGDLVPVERAETMREAVERASARAEAGDLVLLSPGCASFDWYANFEARGDDFKTCVRALVAGAEVAS